MKPGPSVLRFLLPAFCVFVILLHCVSYFHPSGVNWGVHHLAFLPPAFSVLTLLIMCMALLPRAQSVLLASLDGWSSTFTSRRVLWWIIAIAGFAALFWICRQATFFLGDGYLVIRNVFLARNISDIPTAFPTAPLPAVCAYHIKGVLSSFNVEHAVELAWRILSIIAGLLTIPLAFKLAGALSFKERSTWLSAALILSGGALQFSFGYVETYPLAYAGTILFLWLAMEFLGGRRSLIQPLTVFGILLTLHFGMLYLIPAVCVLFLVAIQRKLVSSVAITLVVTPLITGMILWMCGYTLDRLVQVLSAGGSYYLPSVVQDNWQAAYSLFSFWHLVDLLNAYLLLSPFMLLLVPLSLAVVLKSDMRWKPETVFLFLAVCGAMLYTMMTNFEVGLSRDWDVIAPLSVSVVAFALYGWNRLAGDTEEQRRSVLVMTAITLLHTAAWVGVNAGEESSLARYKMLQDERVRSRRAMAYANEDLAGFYRDRKQLAEAIPFLERVTAIDSTNARRWLSLAGVYQSARKRENAMRAYERSIRYGIRDKAAFFNLGILYHNTGRLDEAIAALKHAATIDPADTLISSNLKLMLGRKAQQAK